MRIGFFGAGNMVSAIALGITAKSNEHQLYFYTPTKTKAVDLAEKTRGTFVETLEQMPKDLDWYVLGFKPYNLSEFDFKFNKQTKIISLLASIDVKTIADKFHVESVLRVMPNTPSKIYEGMNLFYFSNSFLKFDKDNILELFSIIGRNQIVTFEKDIDLLTPFTGSGPGIFFELLSYFEKSVPVEISNKYDMKMLLAQTMLGSAKLILSSDATIEELRDNVTSKKGVTIEAIYELRDKKVDLIIKNSMIRALNRLEEMKKEI